jgi:hypothetical protein
MLVESEVEIEDGKIVAKLPITLPTSKVRIKRKDEPIAARQSVINDDDLLEWQISYKKNGSLIEAGKMLKLAYENKLFTQEELEKLEEFAKTTPLFDQNFEIKKEETGKKFLEEFEIIFRHVPIIRKELENGCFVEAELKHKQKAVGYQPMLYIFIPAKNVVSDSWIPLVGRCAQQKEVVKWYPTKKDIEGTIKTFSVLSQKHKSDIIEIINKILSKQPM